ncbi:MAG: hypothetical protein HY754_04280 [Nitrospirae bacterium]|nr:hypothetical protein [Nitrospirota bacterium]
MQVYREHDRQLLIDIKTGKYPLPEVQLMSEKLFAELNAAYANSILPMENDREKIHALLVEIIKTVNGSV